MQISNKKFNEQEQYKQLVEEVSPNSKVGSNCLKAFWVGGAICVFGQFLINLFKHAGLGSEAAGTASSVILIFLAAVLTGIGVYDKIGKYAGAGSLVPITGFSNSVTAPAMEHRSEGLIFGLGAKLFTIAGPVIAYGIATSALVGVFHYAAKML